MSVRSGNSECGNGPAQTTTRTDGPEAELRAALDRFETSLETPIVSGDLASWGENLKCAWAEVNSQVHFQSKHLHPREYEAIANQDPALLPRVERLVAEDDAIEECRERISRTVSRFAEHAPTLEPDEGKAQQHAKVLIDDGLAFINRVRKQSVAIRTWYSEAFDRDQGAVD